VPVNLQDRRCGLLLRAVWHVQIARHAHAGPRLNGELFDGVAVALQRFAVLLRVKVARLRQEARIPAPRREQVLAQRLGLRVPLRERRGRFVVLPQLRGLFQHERLKLFVQRHIVRRGRERNRDHECEKGKRARHAAPRRGTRAGLRQCDAARAAGQGAESSLIDEHLAGIGFLEVAPPHRTADTPSRDHASRANTWQGNIRPDELSAAFQRLRSSTERLNLVTDAASHTIREVEAFLEGVGLGLYASAPIKTLSAPEDSNLDDVYVALEYRRRKGGKFRIAVATGIDAAFQNDAEAVRP